MQGGVVMSAEPVRSDGTSQGTPSTGLDAPIERRLRPPTLQTTVLIGAGLVVAAILYLARAALAPFVIGLFIVYLLDPLVSRLHQRVRLPRWVGVFVVYVALVALVAILIRITIPPLAHQIAALIQRLPDLLSTAIHALESLIEGLDLLPPAIRTELIAYLEQLAASVGSGLGSLDLGALIGVIDPGAIAGSVARLVTAVLAYAVIPIFVFYLLKDRPLLSVAGRSAFPPEWRPDLEAMIRIVDRVFGRWVRGQLLLGLVVGVMTFVGLLALGVIIDPVFRDFAVILAVTAGLLELLPIIGPIISAVPAILLGATAGLPGIIAAFLLYLGVQQVENNVLVPKIQGDATDLHPGIVVAAIVIGGSIAGFLGAILALPLTAAGRDIVRYLLRRTAPEPMSVDVALAEALQPATWREVSKASASDEELRPPLPVEEPSGLAATTPAVGAPAVGAPAVAPAAAPAAARDPASTDPPPAPGSAEADHSTG
jgi:predicted PurR-regulated permease PerM